MTNIPIPRKWTIENEILTSQVLLLIKKYMSDGWRDCSAIAGKMQLNDNYTDD